MKVQKYNFGIDGYKYPIRRKLNISANWIHGSALFVFGALIVYAFDLYIDKYGTKIRRVANRSEGRVSTCICMYVCMYVCVCTQSWPVPL